MADAIVLWTRKAHDGSDHALAFLKANGYAPKDVREIARNPPRGPDLAALAKGVGGDWAALVDAGQKEARPALAKLSSPAAAQAMLERHPEWLKAPLLLTPRGALAGFRETQWRGFLDIGKGRA